MRTRVWFSLRYPFHKVASFMEQTRFRVWGSVLVIGPIGFALLWRERAAPATAEPTRTAEPADD